MQQLWVHYAENVQRLDFNEYSIKRMTVGPSVGDSITVLDFPFVKGAFQLEGGEDGFTIRDGQGKIGYLKIGQPVSVTQRGRSLTLSVLPAPRRSHTYYVGYTDHITFGAGNMEATVNLRDTVITGDAEKRFVLLKGGGRWYADVEFGCPFYLNGKKRSGSVPLQTGDVILWLGMQVRLTDKDVIELSCTGAFLTKLPAFQPPESEVMKSYPAYRRTPRIVYEAPEDKVSLSFPVQEQTDEGRGLWLVILPPLVMLIVMSLVVIFIPRGLFIIISISMFIVTLITSTAQYFRERKRRKRQEEKRRRVYTAYLENMREELYELRGKQQRMLDYHYPAFPALKQMTDGLSGRIWEKTRDNDDFLHFRLGTGRVKASYNLNLSSGDLANREVDDLIEQSKKMEEVFSELDNAPVTADLSKGIIGLFGKEDVIRKEIAQIVGQLSFFHSYHDVRFVYIFNDSKYDQVEWMKWLPHFRLPHMHARGFIHDERSRDQLLGSLYEILRERDNHEDRGKVVFTPHLVFIVSDYRLIGEHVILEYLEGKDHQALGISVIFTADAKERITENVHMLVRYVNDREGDILIRDRVASDTRFRLDRYVPEGDERFARTLRTLDHQVGMTNSLPESVGFLDLYGVTDAEDLPIIEKWETNQSAKSLAVPVGYKGREDLLELNLHEKAHGPHGLLAGTTGSGKSEFLQTYILSLAVNFHPHEVAFLLIDYKGGGMAQPFKNIPHLLGTITNIEGSRNFSLRALASIKSELKRRQRLFDRYTVTHIDEYTSLHKSGVAEEPLPHLFLISDEFAELKNEEPDFIRELVSAARIGRSLGVHLILATQKPGGIIDDQIWSNARFRVALKVQDAADSKEILKNGDAAAITVTGRGYLQVGNNEVYELFQSGWSGAPYLTETYEGEDEVAIVTDLGLEPLTGLSVSDGRKSSLTQIEAVTAKIGEAARSIGANRLSSPWLPPLDGRITQSAAVQLQGRGFAIGIADEPEKQSQYPVGYDPDTDGNTGVFGSPGYGKSYTLQSLILGIAGIKTPEEANFYMLDYGNGSLLPLRQLPHTADYLTLDDELKRDKLIRLIKNEIARRKAAFQKAEVSTLAMYNRIAEEKFPLVYLAIDNYDIIRDEMEELEMQMNQFGRDGQSLGIHILLAATRPMSVRQTLMNNLKVKVVHYLMDSSEMYGIVGRPPYTPEPIPGRAILKKEEALFMQMFLPAQGEDDFTVLESVKEKVRGLKERYADYGKPQPIPMLPAELTLEQFETAAEGAGGPGIVPAGLDEEAVRPVAIDFNRNRHLLIIGLAQRGKTNMMKVLIRAVRSQDTGPVAVFDSFDRGLSAFAQDSRITYADTKESLEAWIADAEQHFAEAEAAYVASIREPGAQVETVPSYLFIDGYSRFLQTADARIQDRLAKLMKNYSHLGFNVIVSSSNAEISKGYDAFTNELKLVRQALVFMKKSEQTILNVPYERKEEELPAGFAHYILNGKSTKIMTPFCLMEKEKVRS